MSSNPALSRLAQRLEPTVVELPLPRAEAEPAKLGLLHHFAELKDPRLKRSRKHELGDILVIAFAAVLGGADSFQAIEVFGNSKRDWFKRFLALPNGIPSHDTFNRVFAALDPDAFQDCFVSWINAVSSRLGLKRYQIDGKALRGSRAGGLGCLYTVSVWASEAGLSLGQQQVDTKSNEITAIPELLKLLDLHGALVSIDAAGCQKAIAKLIKEQGGDYLLALKGNQEGLYEEVVACFEKAWDSDFAGLRFAVVQTEDNKHGRQESRTYTVIYDPPGVDAAGQWVALKTVVAVHRQRVQEGKASEELCYYVSSSGAEAEVLAGGVREHWGIENGCHWVLDVVFGEDACRGRNGHAPVNLAWLRRVALSVLKQDDSKGSLKGKRQRAGWDDPFLEHLLSLLDIPSEMEDA